MSGEFSLSSENFICAAQSTLQIQIRGKIYIFLKKWANHFQKEKRCMLACLKWSKQCDHILKYRRQYFPQIAQKVVTDINYDVIQNCPKYLVHFCKEICIKELSKIAQSGHTAPWLHHLNAATFCLFLTEHPNFLPILKIFWPT